MSSVGNLLSEFRKSRRLSQLDLSTLAEVSSRHISFIENGRSAPSRGMLMRLSDVLDLPLRDSNLLLSAAGFAMTYSHLRLDDEQMQPVKDALNLLLENHNPYPALVMDSCWNVLMINQTQKKIFELVPAQRPITVGEDLCSFSEPINIMEQLFRHDGVRPLMHNWDELASYLLRRLKKQVLAYQRPNAEALFRKLLSLDPPKNWAQPPTEQFEVPMVTAKIFLGELTLSLFSTLSQFGTALDVGMEELLLESYFPADKATKAFFDSIAH